MKQQYGKPMQTAFWSVLVTLLAIGALAGCGSMDISAGVGSGGTGVVKASYTTSLDAAVSSSYLINAVVFLDTNSNYQLDTSEPYAVTGVDGTCSLEATAGELAAAPVIAVAFKGVTVDSASMLPVVNTYVLSAPRATLGAEGNSVVINPISTQLRELLETGRYSSTQQAMAALAGHLGLPQDVNLLAENIAVANPALSAAAKSIAALMWMQTSQILAPGPATPAVDIERYRAMMKLIDENMHIVSRLNTPENLINLNNNITAVLGTMPHKAITP